MAYYPVFLELESKRCLVVGRGAEADARADGLAAAGAEVLRFDGGRELPGTADLDGATLLFFCDPAGVGLEGLLTEARCHDCLVAVNDRPEVSDFVMGAIARKGPITVAVSSAGASPALALRLRDSIDGGLGGEWARAAEIMGRLRPLVAKRIGPQSARARVYRSILDGGLVELVRTGRDDEVVTLIESAVGAPVDRNELGI